MQKQPFQIPKIYVKKGDKIVEFDLSKQKPLEIKNEKIEKMLQKIKPVEQRYSKFTFLNSFKRSKQMFRHEVLSFLDPQDMVKVALLTREIYSIIDENNTKYSSYAVTGKLSTHFMEIFKCQKEMGYDPHLINQIFKLSDLYQLVKKQKFFEFFAQASDFHKIQGLVIPEQINFLKKVWLQQGSILTAKVQPRNPKGGYLGYREIQAQIGQILRNPIKDRIIQMSTTEMNDFFRDQVLFSQTQNRHYIRIVEIFCNSKEQQQEQADVKKSKGVTGIGRQLIYQYDTRKNQIQAYNLIEGEIERGELNGFGRQICCYGKSHDITTGFFENGELFQSRPFDKKHIAEFDEEELQKFLI